MANKLAFYDPTKMPFFPLQGYAKYFTIVNHSNLAVHHRRTLSRRKLKNLIFVCKDSGRAMGKSFHAHSHCP